MQIVRFEPFRDLLGLQDRMTRLFEESYRATQRSASEEQRAAAASWAPAVDIYEQGTDIVLKAELPGVDPKDVDIRLENNVLILRGQRQLQGDVKRESYHRVERSYGTFSRSFTLPTVVDQAQVKAEFKDGLLQVTLPKREEAKPKQIQINVAQ
ncbi:MAG: Hsp20/alpha crystallin family protein [Vicinamibacteria bacterium]